MLGTLGSLRYSETDLQRVEFPGGLAVWDMHAPERRPEVLMLQIENSPLAEPEIDHRVGGETESRGPETDQRD